MCKINLTDVYFSVPINKTQKSTSILCGIATYSSFFAFVLTLILLLWFLQTPKSTNCITPSTSLHYNIRVMIYLDKILIIAVMLHLSLEHSNLPPANIRISSELKEVCSRAFADNRISRNDKRLHQNSYFLRNSSSGSSSSGSSSSSSSSSSSGSSNSSCLFSSTNN